MKDIAKEASFPFFERTPFLVGVTMFGGYINAYSFLIRNERMIGFQSGNQVHLGIALATLNWEELRFYSLPIVMCFLGICLNECLRWIFRRFDWNRMSLFLEALALFFVGFFPSSQNTPAACLLALTSGIHFCVFRSWEGLLHTTTIATGNLRNLALLFCEAVAKGHSSCIRLLRYLPLFLAFPCGAFFGAWFSLRLKTYGIWPLSVFLFLWGILYCIQAKKAQTQKACQAVSEPS